MNSDLYWSAETAALADPCEFVLALAHQLRQPALQPAHLRAVSQWEGWIGQLKLRNAQKERKNQAGAQAKAYGHSSKEGVELLNPLMLCEALEAQMADDSIIVADGGDFVATASYILRPRAPLSWLDPGAFGTLGVGGGFALAAALARPSAEVWLIWGDGSAGYSIAEVDTMVRHGVKVMAMIGNDGAWTQIDREQKLIFDSSVSCVLEYCDYGMVSRGYGGGGVTLSKEPEQSVAQGFKAVQVSKTAASQRAALGAGIARAQAESAASGKPVVINALVGATNFRDGSLSV